MTAADVVRSSSRNAFLAVACSVPYAWKFSLQFLGEVDRPFHLFSFVLSSDVDSPGKASQTI